MLVTITVLNITQSVTQRNITKTSEEYMYNKNQIACHQNM